MNVIPVKPILILLLVLIALAAEAADVPRFATMTGNAHVVVEYSSGGCWHNSKYICDFIGRDVTIVEVKREFSEEKNEYVDGGTFPVGRLRLSKMEMAGLDTLFAFYKSGPKRQCTTSHTVRVRLDQGTRLSEPIEFVDASCDTRYIEDVTTFGHIVWRLKKLKEVTDLDGPVKLTYAGYYMDGGTTSLVLADAHGHSIECGFDSSVDAPTLDGRTELVLTPLELLDRLARLAHLSKITF